MQSAFIHPIPHLPLLSLTIFPFANPTSSHCSSCIPYSLLRCWGSSLAWNVIPSYQQGSILMCLLSLHTVNLHLLSGTFPNALTPTPHSSLGLLLCTVCHHLITYMNYMQGYILLIYFLFLYIRM